MFLLNVEKDVPYGTVWEDGAEMKKLGREKREES
jgi:hypothetical protein